MTKWFSLLVGMIFSFNAFAVGGGNGDDAVRRPRRPGHILFKLKNNLSEAEQRKVYELWMNYSLAQKKANVFAFEGFSQTQGVTSEEEFAEKLKATGAVQYAEPDYLVYPALSFSNPYIKYEWHLKTVKAQDAWDTTIGRSNVIVTVCDSGVDAAHVSLKGNVIQPGFNTVDGSTNSSPVATHGTAVAGVIAARKNGPGTIGVAPGVKIFPVRVSNSSSGSAYLSDLAECVRYAADHGSKVVNVSYSGQESSEMGDAGKYAMSKGTVMVMAAGNSSQDISSIPAYPYFLRVAATDADNSLASFSNYGKAVDLAAPGVDILTTSPGNRYTYISGTSFSAPLTAGVAALVVSARPDLKPATVIKILKDSATYNGNSYYFGAGLLNADAAVDLARRYPGR